MPPRMKRRDGCGPQVNHSMTFLVSPCTLWLPLLDGSQPTPPAMQHAAVLMHKLQVKLCFQHCTVASRVW